MASESRSATAEAANATEGGWELFAHDADIGVRGFGTTRGMLFGRFTVRIEGHGLYGKAWGEPVDVARHSPATEVKGATYTELCVAKREDGRWVAQCVVDV